MTDRKSHNSSEFDSFRRLAANNQPQLLHLIETAILPQLRLSAASAARDLSNNELLSAIMNNYPIKVAELTLPRSAHRTLEELLLDDLVPIAVYLGQLWENDTCDFLTVTAAMGRLHLFTQHLCNAREMLVPFSARRILLMPSPGEAHIYGLTIVGSFFRQAGWATTILHGSDDPIRCLREGAFDALGLSLASDTNLPALLACLPDLRRASANPDLCVIVGGSAVLRTDLRAELLDMDTYPTDVREAPAFAEAWLANRLPLHPQNGPRICGGQAVDPTLRRQDNKFTHHAR